MKFLMILEDGSPVQLDEITDDTLAEIDQGTASVYKFENGIFQELKVRGELVEAEGEDEADEMSYEQTWQAVKEA